MNLTPKMRNAIHTSVATSTTGDYALAPTTHHSTRRALIARALVKADGWTLTAEGEELRGYVAMREAEAHV